ncbi:MAG: hypothetical protein KAR47_08555 [Planctomycetes bacterium]|nr:hypothetical protein [Planctomycetota bacterium]
MSTLRKKCLCAFGILLLYFMAAMVNWLTNIRTTVICSTRLKGVGSHFAGFYSEYDRMPEDLVEIINYSEKIKDYGQKGLTIEDHFVCRSDYQGSSDSISYVYRGNDLKSDISRYTSDIPRGMILIYEKNPNHKIYPDFWHILLFDFGCTKVRTVLFNDIAEGLALTDEEFQEAIEKDNAIRRQIGLPEKGV